MLWNMKLTMRPIVIDSLGMVPKSLEKSQEEMEIKGRIKTIKNIAVKICKNILKSPRDLRRLPVTQAPVKNYQWK